MECNRDEATRAKEIAERKFKAKDIAAAKKFASKAQNLNPALEGISQMLATFEVYLASENKVSGETDWYAILGVSATADDDTVKKQYRKLALMLHPDKNKSIGAEGAFKLLSEAWSVLSDKSRRSAYDQKRNVKGPNQKVQQQNKDSSAAPNANGFYNSAKATTHSRPQKNASRTAAPSSVPTSLRPSKTNTFWTVCNQCKMQYEYLRVYLNHNLLCPSCHKPFLAVETGSPANGPNSSVSFSFPQHHRQQNASKNAYVQGRNTSPAQNVGTAGYPNQANFQWGPFSGTAGVASAAASSSAAAQAANVVHQTYEKVRKEREEAQAATRKEEALRRKNHASRRTTTGSFVGNSNAVPGSHALERPAKKRRGIDDNGGSSYGRDDVEETGSRAHTTGRHVNAHTGSETERVNGVSRDYLSTRNVLIEMARTMIRKKLEEWNSAAASKVPAKEVEKETEATSVQNVVACNENKSDEPVDEKKHAAINVPDPDFHDFDKDRTEKSFDANQVWAAYDDDDGMPRFYALIQKVISLEPFKMRFSWLNSKTNSELGPINWVASGFTKTCGEFRVGRYEVNDTVNVFSHRVRWEKGVRGVVKITPKRGDVWAIYRNWSPNWSETTPDTLVHKYDMVEVLDDYDEEHGVSVTPLVKVAGFKTVFHRHMDPAQVRRIPREEMFRFSHQVPSWLLTGEEAENAPKGCRELDPAATPLELLQVITETREDKVVESGKSVQEETATKQDMVVEMIEQIQLSREDEVMETVQVKEQIQETMKDGMVESREQKQEGNEDVVIDSTKQIKETNVLIEKIRETNGVAPAKTADEQVVS